AEVRAQAARVLGWMKAAAAGDLLPLLKDAQPRVRFQALTTLGNAEAVALRAGEGPMVWDAVVDLLKENSDRDAYLRHAASRVLARYAEQPLADCSRHEAR